MSPHRQHHLATVFLAATLLGSGLACQGSLPVGESPGQDSSIAPGTDAGTPGTDAGLNNDAPESPAPMDAAVKDARPPVDATAKDASAPVDATTPPPPPTDAAPAAPATLRMVFPISGVSTAATVTARGTTDGKNVAKVTVNGTAATSADGFLTWKASVPLTTGSNVITAVLERSDASQLQASATVTRVASDSAIKRGKLLAGVSLNLLGGSVDSHATAMYLADANMDGVLRVDIATGDQTWATCSEHANPCGEGPKNGVPFSQPMDVAVDEAHGRAFVIDGQNVFAVDLSGQGGAKERTIVSGPEVSEASYTPPTYAARGSGPLPRQFGSMSYDPVANVIYAVDWGMGNDDPVGFFKIDPETGDRQVIATSGHGDLFRQIDLSTAKGALYVTTAYQSSLTLVAVADGKKTTGPSISEPQALAASDALGALFAVDKSGTLIAFEGAALTSRTLAHLGVGPGLSVGGGLVFIYDGALNGVAAFDPQSGERIVVSR